MKKHVICLVLALSLLFGCTQKVLAPVLETEQNVPTQVPTVPPTMAPTEAPATPAPTAAPRPLLATFVPRKTQEARFAEELLSQDGEPIGSAIRSLLTESGLSKTSFHTRFIELCQQVNVLNESLLRLSEASRTMTADRKEQTVRSLLQLMDDETLTALQDAYARCPGEGETLPLTSYTASMDVLIQEIEGMKDRTNPFYGLGADTVKDYKAVLDRYMGESILPRTMLANLEELAQTEAYAISAALEADPEAARKKEPLSFGSFTQNMAFLHKVTETLCPLPDGTDLPILPERAAGTDKELFELAFWTYPGMAYLKAYAAHAPEAQQARWANASDGYLAGLAIHGSYCLVPYLEDFGLHYVQYRWYADMLDVTLTGISALLIHYYGYSEKDLAAYLKNWGAEAFTGYLYDKAMSDPFESLVASCGYYQYLDICGACLDAGCENEQSFLRDYLSVGPAPYADLKEYMVDLYQNQG